MLEVIQQDQSPTKSFKRKFESIHSDEDDEEDTESSFLHPRKKKKTRLLQVLEVWRTQERS